MHKTKYLTPRILLLKDMLVFIDALYNVEIPVLCLASRTLRRWLSAEISDLSDVEKRSQPLTDQNLKS